MRFHIITPSLSPASASAPIRAATNIGALSPYCRSTASAHAQTCSSGEMEQAPSEPAARDLPQAGEKRTGDDDHRDPEFDRKRPTAPSSRVPLHHIAIMAAATSRGKPAPANWKRPPGSSPYDLRPQRRPGYPSNIPAPSARQQSPCTGRRSFKCREVITRQMPHACGGIPPKAKSLKALLLQRLFMVITSGRCG